MCVFQSVWNIYRYVSLCACEPLWWVIGSRFYNTKFFCFLDVEMKITAEKERFGWEALGYSPLCCALSVGDL